MDRRYLFLKNKRILFLIVLTLIASSCISKNIWNFKEEDLRDKCKRSDFEVFKSIDFKKINLAEAFSFGPGAGYYFSRIFKKLSLDTVSREMLRSAYANEKSIWKEETGLLLLEFLFQTNDPAPCEKIAGDIISTSANPSRIENAKRFLIRALFEEKKDSELLSAVLRFYPNFPRTDAELLFYRGAALLRLEKYDEAMPLILSVFFLDADKTIYLKAYAFLSSLENKAMTDNPHIKRLGIARGLDATGILSVGTAILADECLALDFKKEGISDDVVSSVVEEVALGYLTSKEYKKGIAFLSAMAKKLDGRSRVTAIVYLGRTYRKAENYPLAVSSLGEAVASVIDAEEKDRATWYLLDAVKESGSKDFLKNLIDSAKTWSDPDYFEDLLEKVISDIVATHRWNDLKILYDGIKQYGSTPIMMRLSYLLARTASLKLPGTTPETAVPQEYLEYVSSLDGFNYYTFIASALLGKTPPVFETLNLSMKIGASQPFSEKANRSQSLPATADKKIKPDKDIDNFVKGFFDFGLVDEGFDALKKNLESMSDEAVDYSLARLKEREHRNEYIRVANKVAYIKNYQVTSGLISYQYPLEFSSFIEEYAKRDGVSNYLLYGLVRQESAFDASIVSSAGAIGLSQLMPETAKDVAALLKMKTFDLNDPKTNLSIGSYYLARLYKKLGTLPKALIGYNAGITHTREWTKLYGDLPSDLFVEAIPFAETRDYLRKVVSSAVVYGYFYNKLKLQDILKEFYPELVK